MTWESAMLAQRMLATPSNSVNGGQSTLSVGRNSSDFSSAHRDGVKVFGQFTPQVGVGHSDWEDAVESRMDSAEQEKTCRICLCEEDDPDDPIVRPCRCQGTMRDVHVKCFKK